MHRADRRYSLRRIHPADNQRWNPDHARGGANEACRRFGGRCRRVRPRERGGDDRSQPEWRDRAVLSEHRLIRFTRVQ